MSVRTASDTQDWEGRFANQGTGRVPHAPESTGLTAPTDHQHVCVSPLRRVKPHLLGRGEGGTHCRLGAGQPLECVQAPKHFGTLERVFTLREFQLIAQAPAPELKSILTTA